MKFKVSFARIVNEAQLVEAVIEADTLEAAQAAFDKGDFKRWLVVKRDLREITPVGNPEFKEISR